MYLSTLSEWQSFISSVHPLEIDLGLDRVKKIAERLNLLSFSVPIVIVGGTNGKGSTVAGLEAIYLKAGFKVGAFTSPYLFHLTEEIRVQAKAVSEKEWCDAFEKIEAMRWDVSLTSFEFVTLAALLIFKTYELDLILLEVGLGGRLDAVNILDADVSVITSIGIDHVELLGRTREKIAYEKAGIFRKDKPAVCGDRNPPVALVNQAMVTGTPLYCLGKDFDYREDAHHFSWFFENINYDALPLSSLATQNMAIVLMVVSLLQTKLPVDRVAIDAALREVSLPGRIQIIPGAITQIYDVSHNEDAVLFLAKKLTQLHIPGKTHAVFSMLADKEIERCLLSIQEKIDGWYVAPLNVERGATDEKLQNAFRAANIKNVNFYASIPEAYEHAFLAAKPGDCVVTFGSFYVIAEVSQANNMK